MNVLYTSIYTIMQQRCSKQNVYQMAGDIFQILIAGGGEGFSKTLNQRW